MSKSYNSINDITECIGCKCKTSMGNDEKEDRSDYHINFRCGSNLKMTKEGPKFQQSGGCFVGIYNKMNS